MPLVLDKLDCLLLSIVLMLPLIPASEELARVFRRNAQCHHMCLTARAVPKTKKPIMPTELYATV